MSVFRYSKFDPNDLLNLDKEELMDELSRNLLHDGDLSSALQRMRNLGFGGKPYTSLQDLLQRLQKMRQSRLDRYKMDSLMEGIEEKLADVLQTERAGIQRKVEEAAQAAREDRADLGKEMQESLRKAVEDMARQHREKLDALPPDAPGRMKGFMQYDFMDAEAERKFQELKKSLMKSALESYSRDLTQQLKELKPEDLARMREMMRDLNEMLERKQRGEDPGFAEFMRKWGANFGPNPPSDLEELLDRLQEQMAQARSLFESMSEEQRQQLQDVLESLLDEETLKEMARFADNLEALNPGSGSEQSYPFRGEESISFNEGLRLMEEFRKMDRLQGQLEDSRYHQNLNGVDRDLMEDLLGPEGARDLEALNDIAKVLEEAGFIRLNEGKYELTPRGMRKIGQKALKDIFSQLRKDQIGNHALNKSGFGVEREEETKPYEFGDPLWLNLQKTIMNALQRESQTPPLKLATSDFEVYRTQQLTSSTTVLMLDLSLSMPMFNNFEAAKRVTIALDELIRTQFPQDRLFIVGFSTYARVLRKEQLLQIDWNQFDPYTNMQHGFFVARRLLDRERSANKNIILVSDGEPTAHVEGGQIYFRYPPSARTIAFTLEEVRKCTQKGIVINTFMLQSNDLHGFFVSRMARLNKGRVFHTSASQLGEYLLVDYISGKKKRIN